MNAGSGVSALNGGPVSNARAGPANAAGSSSSSTTPMPRGSFTFAYTAASRPLPRTASTTGAVSRQSVNAWSCTYSRRSSAWGCPRRGAPCSSRSGTAGGDWTGSDIFYSCDRGNTGVTVPILYRPPP